MKTAFYLATALLLGFALNASADDMFMGRVGRPLREQNPKLKTDLTKPGPGKVVGRCTMLASTGGLGDTPCVELILILKDGKGAEVVRTRTDRSGNFAFEATDNTPYTIDVSSKLVQVVAPTEAVMTEKMIELKIRQK